MPKQSKVIMWVSVNLRTDTKKIYFLKETGLYVRDVLMILGSIIHIMGEGVILHDHIMASTLLTLRNLSKNIETLKTPQIDARISYQIHL